MEIAHCSRWIVNSTHEALLVRETTRFPWLASRPLGEAVSVVLVEPWWWGTVVVGRLLSTPTGWDGDEVGRRPERRARFFVKEMSWISVQTSKSLDRKRSWSYQDLPSKPSRGAFILNLSTTSYPRAQGTMATFDHSLIPPVHGSEGGAEYCRTSRD
jgi:hypothetical protein